MNKIVAWIRWGIIIVSPLYLLNAYTLSIYKLPLNDYLGWLFNGRSSDSFTLAPVLISFCLFVIIVFWFSLFVNRFYTKIFGSHYEYVYLGNVGKFKAHYYQAQSIDNKVYETISPDIEYNYTFENIEKKQMFIQEGSLKEELGRTVGQYSLGGLVSLLNTSLLFIIPFIATYHVCIAAMKADLFMGDYEDNLFSRGWESSLESLFSSYGINLGSMLIAWFIVLVMMFILTIKFPRQQFSGRHKSLPSAIKSDNTLEAKPVAISIVYDKKNHNKQRLAESTWIESKKRNVTFEFSSYFKFPVYVTAIINITKQDGIENYIKSNIESRVTMKIKVLNDLSIMIDDL